MKKFFYLLLAVVAIGIYSCQKDNTAPASKGLNGTGISLKGKKDTTPPDPTINALRVKKDTTPPDPTFNSLTIKRDTTPPDPTLY